MTWEGTLRDFRRHLKLERGLSENTLAAYGKDVEKLSLWAVENALSPRQINLESLREFLKTQSSLSARSQARLITSIKTFFKFLVFDGVLESDPTELLESPRIGRKLPDYLTDEEIDKMIQSIDLSQEGGERNKAILEVLYGCGLRVSELISLRLSDIHKNEGIIRVIGKGDKEQLVPIHDGALRVLLRYIQEVRIHDDPLPGEEDIVFLSRRGKRLARSTVFTFIVQIARAVGITKKIGPHTFRHSFATALVNNGADLRVVQQLLGHESITTTEIYTHLNETQLRQAMEKHPWSKK